MIQPVMMLSNVCEQVMLVFGAQLMRPIRIGAILGGVLTLPGSLSYASLRVKVSEDEGLRINMRDGQRNVLSLVRSTLSSFAKLKLRKRVSR